MASEQRTPLSQIASWPDNLVQILAAKGIFDAEQLIAIAKQENGLHSLATEMGITTDEAAQLVAKAREQLTPESAAQLEAPVPQHGLGAHKPPQIQDVEADG